MNGPYRCGCVEQYGLGFASLKLPTNRPLVFVQDALPGWTRDDIWTWLKEGHDRWASVCDWKATRIMSLNDALPNDIVQLVTAADLGGGGVLADQVLPYTGGKVLRMRINTRIKWKPTDGQFTGGTIDPIRTLEHESGHFQGHQHWPTGAPPELMEPYISQTIIRPQPTEAKVSAGWFGQPGLPTPPIPGGYDFSEIGLDWNQADTVRVDLTGTRLWVTAPIGLKLTDKNGKPAVVTWP